MIYISFEPNMHAEQSVLPEKVSPGQVSTVNLTNGRCYLWLITPALAGRTPFRTVRDRIGSTGTCTPLAHRWEGVPRGYVEGCIRGV